MDNQNQSQEVGKIVDIRKQVEEHVGQTIEITSQFGRKRENRHKVNLIETYATHFVIENIQHVAQKQQSLINMLTF